MRNIEREFRKAIGFEWLEGIVGYQPSEIGPGEVHEELKKARYVGAAPSAPGFDISEIFRGGSGRTDGRLP